MKSTLTVTTALVLVLTAEETAWLRGVMQNPAMETEDPYDTEMRIGFFNALAHYSVETGDSNHHG